MDFWTMQFNDIRALFFSRSMTFRHGRLDNADHALGLLGTWTFLYQDF